MQMAKLQHGQTTDATERAARVSALPVSWSFHLVIWTATSVSCRHCWIKDQFQKKLFTVCL